MSLVTDFLSLIFPDLCQVCGNSLFRGERIICLKCMHHLPRARFSDDPRNPAAQVFWGRVPARAVIIAFLYNKGNAVQKLVHQFKYRGVKEIGLFLGEELGKEFLKNRYTKDIDLIIPVPLHRKKQKKRGFNQSEIIGKGVSAVIHAELNTSILLRRSFSATQTRKSKYQRWENVEHIFYLRDPGMIKNRHILLIDDVITTGATMEACAQALLQVEGVRLSLGAVAFTRL